MVRSRGLLAVLLCAGLSQARAWTPILEISAASSNERSTPRVVRSPANELLTAYINKGSPWRVYARQRSAAGTWGPVEAISGTGAGSTRPDVAFDRQGRPHIVYASYLTGGALDLVHACKSGGAWTVNALTATSHYEDEPHVVTDSGGRIHMVFTRGDKESSAADVVYRRWNGSAWEGETVIGHTDHAYYRRPEICIDPANLLHVTWGEKVGSNYVVRYARSDGTAWPGPVDVGTSTNWPGTIKVAAASTGSVLVVWDDNALFYNYSNTGGSTWAFGAAGQSLSGNRSPALDGGAGMVHLVSTLPPNNRALGYSRWNGSTWTVVDQVIWSNSNWKGWPDVVADAAGVVHAVWDEAYGSETYQHYIGYSTSAADTTPPLPVTGFAAVAGHNRVSLSWTNPADPDYQATVIRVSTTGYPVSASDGVLLAERPAAAGSGDSLDHTTVVNGRTCYYAVFARDTTGLYSTAATAAATPFLPPDMDRDGDVDQSDFGLLQACMSGSFIPQLDPACQQARMDGDDDVDSYDLGVFMGCVSGAGVPYVPTCAG